MPVDPSSSETHKIVLIIRHPVPTINALFAMTHWGRHRERKKTQDAFACGWSVSGDGSLTPITWLPSGSSTVSAMRATSQTTERKTLSLKSARKKFKAKQTNTPASK